MSDWFDFALLFYFKMLGVGVCPDKYTFPYVVKACCGVKSVRMGKLVHDMIQLIGLENDIFVASSLIKLYAENGCVTDARYLFDKMPHKDCVLWNVMMHGHLKNGGSPDALGLFTEMRKIGSRPNAVTFVSVLSACASEGMVSLAAQIHGLVTKYGFEMDSAVANTLLAVYAKCKSLSDALTVLNTMPQTDVVTWNAIISGFVQNGMMNEALHLFHQMLSHGVKPDSVTFSSLIPSITESVYLNRGKEVHGYIIRSGVQMDAFLKCALIDLYFKCRDVNMAFNIFKQDPIGDVGVYTAMISGCVLNGMNKDATKVFKQLLDQQISPNSMTLASVFPAFANSASIRHGMELHGFIIKNSTDSFSGFYVQSAILDMYSKCGRLELARQIFINMNHKDGISWNSMITSCTQNGKPEEAINLFRQMGAECFQYDCVSISSALSACANLPSLHHGKEIHGYMMKNRSCSDIFGESTLIDMYAKCGNLEQARHVFNMMDEKNEVSWNSIIAAYGNHGLLTECVHFFEKMLGNSFQPDHVTFLAVISACGHAGKIDDGIHYFHCMTEKFSISARMEHYGCMVDLFGRAGRLTEAYETVKNMPFPPDAGIWGTLLGASRVHGNVELAEVASRHLLELDPENSGYHILLSNLHADAGQWKGVLKVRNLMKERGLRKVPGRSWIEVQNATHVFVAADDSHSQCDAIYLVLRILVEELRKEGYITQNCLARKSVDQEMYVVEEE